MMNKDIANWKELQAEIVSAEIERSDSKYVVVVRYRYFDGNAPCVGQYISRSLASESVAKAYVEAALSMACP